MKQDYLELIKQNKVPRHVAIIMDGNGRWAQEKGKERTFGHKNGVEAVRESIKGCIEKGVQYLTLFAFSSENWKRPEAEVDFLMSLLVEAIHSEVPSLMENNIKLETIGDISRLPQKSIDSLRFAKEETSHNTALTLILALNYGSKDELIQATKKIAREVQGGALTIDDINEDCLNKHLYTFPYPNPDIMIRTSGEQRISNFLLWQLAYAEFFFLDKFWPDFTRDDLFACIESYQKRDRRFGGI